VLHDARPAAGSVLVAASRSRRSTVAAWVPIGFVIALLLALCLTVFILVRSLDRSSAKAQAEDSIRSFQVTLHDAIDHLGSDITALATAASATLSRASASPNFASFPDVATFREAYTEIMQDLDSFATRHDFVWVGGVAPRIRVEDFGDVKSKLEEVVGVTIQVSTPFPGRAFVWPFVFSNTPTHPFVSALFMVDSLFTPEALAAEQLSAATAQPVSTTPYRFSVPGEEPWLLQPIVQRVAFCNASSPLTRAPCDETSATEDVLGVAALSLVPKTLLQHVLNDEPFSKEIGVRVELGEEETSWNWPSPDEGILLARTCHVSAFNWTWDVQVVVRDSGISDSANLASWTLLGAGALFAIVLAAVWHRQLRHSAKLAQRRAEEAQHLAHHEAAMRRDALIMFLRTTSHDMRTPLHAVLLGLEEAALAQGEQERQESLSMARGSASMLDLIVSNVLDVGRIERNELRLEVTPTSLVPLFASLVDMVRSMMNGTSVEVIHRGRPPALVCDASRILRCALNALSNSRKFTRDGRIVLETVTVMDEASALQLPLDLIPHANTAHATVVAHTWRHPDFGAPGAATEKGRALLCVTVADTGRGMSPHEVESCVSPFVFTATGNAHGTGLGLHVVLGSVLAHRGFLTVASAPDVGTTVRMCFPTRLATNGGATPPTLSAGTSHSHSEQELKGVPFAQPQATVLVVDDEALNAKLMRRIIQRMLGPDANVRCASNGEEALHLVQESGERVGLVFMDARMPVMDGLEATRQIRGIAGSAAQPRIVMLTGNATEEDRRAAAEAGADAFEAKPCSRQAIILHLRRAGFRVARGAAISGMKKQGSARGMERGGEGACTGSESSSATVPRLLALAPVRGPTSRVFAVGESAPVDRVAAPQRELEELETSEAQASTSVGADPDFKSTEGGNAQESP